MSSLRAVFLFLASLSLFSFTGFGFLAYDAWKSRLKLEDKLAQSYNVLSHAQKAFDGDKKVELNFKLQPNFRQKTLTAFEKNRRSRTRLTHLLKTELSFQKYLYQLKPELTRRVQVYWLLAFVFSAVSSLLYFLFLKNSIFKPIFYLNRRMQDFLNNRYSYEFEAPANNELGRLHSAFNQLAQKVLDQIHDLTQLDRAKSEFLSIASHELRTPLTSIKGSLSLLEHGVIGEVNPETKSLLGIAGQETDRLIRLINELLDLAKIEAGQFPLNKKWIPLDQLLKKTKDSLQGLAESAHVKLEFHCNPHIETLIDSDRIQQVITNLASNAIKFSPKDSKVILRVIEENNNIILEVEDSGPGIAPEDQVLIFEKFRQATSEENPLVKGTGLGLAIARAIVEEHGGEISVRSFPGKGSVFLFSLCEWRLSKAIRVSA